MAGKMKQTHYFVTDTNTTTNHTQALNWVNTNVIIDDDDENDVARNTSIEVDMASNRKFAQVRWMRKQTNGREELAAVMMKTATTASESIEHTNVHTHRVCRVSKVIAIITISPIEYVTKSSNHFLSRFILFSRINSHTPWMCACVCLSVVAIKLLRRTKANASSQMFIVVNR